MTDQLGLPRGWLTSLTHGAAVWREYFLDVVGHRIEGSSPGRELGAMNKFLLQRRTKRLSGSVAIRSAHGAHR
jgi:hypothetical protein